MAGRIAYCPDFAKESICSLCRQDVVSFSKIHTAGGGVMKIRKKILDFEYEEVLDARTRELIRVGCAVAVGCPT